MAENIVMPQLGESIAEGTIVKWLKNVGDAVQKDENILLISTDKVEAEIPAPSAGVLISIDVQPGETVAVGTVLGKVGQAQEASAKKVETKAEEKKTEEKVAPQQEISFQSNGPIKSLGKETPVALKTESTDRAQGFLSPLVRKIASENQVSDQELSSVSGTGREGRITKKDLLDYIEAKKAGRVSAEPKAPSMPTVSSEPKSVTTPKPPSIEMPAGEREVLKPISTMRRVIMDNMVASRKKSAHVTTFFEIDYSRIDQVRNQHKDRFKAEEGVALTYTTFLAAATCLVLKRHPYINAEIQEDKIRFRRDVHLGIAVAIEEPEPGLMVPVVKNADQMNLRGLSRAIHDLANRTRSRRIKPDELSGGSFTITNPGNYGAVIGTPIINQPQVAILGVGQIKKQPVVIEANGMDSIGIRNMGWLALSFDHRLIDGATADLFMADLKQTLETWSITP